jgi:hypothetical protein
MRSNKSIARQNLLVSVVNVALERGLVTTGGPSWWWFPSHHRAGRLPPPRPRNVADQANT